MENENPLSDLGEWKDVQAYPMYRISSTGAVMNKKTLNILKHFKHYESGLPCVTLYRAGNGDVLSVALLLKLHFPDAVFNVMEHSIPKQTGKNKPNHTTESADLFLDD